MRVQAGIARWFDQRYPMGAIRSAVRSQATKLLPPHVGWLHTMGGMLIFLAVQQVLTGILLMVYYRPTTEEARESVRFLMTEASFGWLIRGLHAWGAHLMIAVLVLHMLRVFLMGAYKKPRELTWVGGVLLFFLVLVFGFTGYLLPWDQLAYWATTVGTEVAASIPAVGESLGYLVRGGEAVGQETLSRFYVLHVVALPWILAFLVVLHIVMIRMQGLAPFGRVGEGEKPAPEEGIPFMPDHVSREMVVFPLFFALLVTLVILFPPHLGEKADPTVTPEGIKPEWYFLPMYQFLKYLPKETGLVFAMLPPVLLLAWPFLDRSPWRRPARRRISVTLGLTGLVLSILLGVAGHLAETEVHLLGRTIRFDVYAIPEVLPEEG